MNFINIKSTETANMGGGCMVDILTLNDGRVIVISDEYLGMYESKDAFFDSADQLNGFYLQGE